MLNILVTGANGQLGNELRKIAEADTTLHYLFTDVAELDITKPEHIRDFMEKEKVDIVVNCAAYTNVDKAEDDEEMADLLNHKAVKYLAEACKANNATLIHISTDYVFQGNRNTPQKENEPIAPQSVYGRTKAGGEQAVLDSGCRYMIFRTAWLYSSFGNNFVKTMLRLTAEKDKLNVIFDQVGSPTHAKDLAAAIVHVIANDLYKTQQGVYHYSNEGVCSWYDFAKEIASLSGNTRCEINPCHSDEYPSKVKRPAFSVLDKTKVKTELGCKVPYWKDSLIQCISELKQ